MSKIPNLDNTVRKLFEDKFGKTKADVAINAAQKCIDAGGTVASMKSCLKKAVVGLTPEEQADALVILYHFVIVG